MGGKQKNPVAGGIDLIPGFFYRLRCFYDVTNLGNSCCRVPRWKLLSGSLLAAFFQSGKFPKNTWNENTGIDPLTSRWKKYTVYVKYIKIYITYVNIYYIHYNIYILYTFTLRDPLSNPPPKTRGGGI